MEAGGEKEGGDDGAVWKVDCTGLESNDNDDDDKGKSGIEVAKKVHDVDRIEVDEEELWNKWAGYTLDDFVDGGANTAETEGESIYVLALNDWCEDFKCGVTDADESTECDCCGIL